MNESVTFLLVSAAVIIGMIVIAKVIEKCIGFKHSAESRTRRMVFIAIFSAISAVLMFLDFSIAFLAPGFYKFDFSEVPVLICGFAYGPMAGVVTEFIKVMLKLLMKGTVTLGVGDLANFLVGCMLVLPATCIYHIKKSRNSALIGMGVGTLIMAVFGGFFNAVYLLPAYAALFHSSVDDFVAAGTAINSHVTSVTSLVMICVVPFNLFKGVVVSLLTALLYKRLSPLIHKANVEQQ